MALVIEDRVRETSTTTGTGAYTLAGAVVGFKTFSSGVGEGNTAPYVAVMGSNWETGIGTYSAGTFARTTVFRSTNGDSAVNWGAGTKEIALSVPSDLFPILQGGNTFDGNQVVESSTGDVMLEVHGDGDHVPRINWRRSNALSDTNRHWQSRIDPSGRWVLKDNTAGSDRLMVDTSGLVRPGTTNAQDIGTSSFRWRSLLLSQNIRIEGAIDNEIDVHSTGDGNKPAVRLRKSGVTTDTAKDYRLEVDDQGRLELHDLTNVAVVWRVNVNNHFAPGSDNALTCGTSGTRWSAVWAANGTIQTSDARQKTDVAEIDLGLEWIDQLRPVIFRWKDSGKLDRGLIAQEVAATCPEFNGLQHDPETDIYGLNYSAFVPSLIAANQELSRRTQALEAVVAELEAAVADLKAGS